MLDSQQYMSLSVEVCVIDSMLALCQL